MMSLPELCTLDGGLATELANHGHEDMNTDPLWNSRLLSTNPKVIVKAHNSFLEAGSDIIETASYQASIEGFQKYLGCSSESARELIASSVHLAKQACEEYARKHGHSNRALVAGSVGPYGACLHDASEYTGAYVDSISVEELVNWHRPRVQALLEAGADILAFDTIPAQKEAEAIVQLLREFPAAKAWVSFSCKNGTKLCHGELFSAVATSLLVTDGVFGVGINCTPPEHVASLLHQLSAEVRANKRIIVYPNSGETWTEEKTWSGKDSVTRPVQDYVLSWLQEGAQWVGGCCRVTPSDIACIKAEMNKFSHHMDKPP